MISAENFKMNRRSSNPQPTDDVELRVQLYVPKVDTSPIQLNYIDVTRSIQTYLDVLQEKRIDDFCNVVSKKHLSES